MVIIHRNRLFADCLAQVTGGRCLTYGGNVDIEDGEVVVVGLEIGTQQTIQIGRGRKALVLIRSLDTEEDKAAMLACVEAKIFGYTLEETTIAEFQAAVADVEAGKSHCSEGVLEAMLNHLAQLSKAFNWSVATDNILSVREMEILKWIAEDLSNKEIAARIHLSLYTVKNHVHNIMVKLGCSSRRDAVLRAINNGWLRPTNFV